MGAPRLDYVLAAFCKEEEKPPLASFPQRQIGNRYLLDFGISGSLIRKRYFFFVVAFIY